MATNNLFAALRSTLISGVAIGVMNFLLQIYLARVMGVSVIVDYAKIVVVAQLVLLFTSFSFNHALIGVGYSDLGFQNLLSLSLVQMIIVVITWIIVGLVMAWMYPQDLAQLAWPTVAYIIGMVTLTLGHTFNASFEAKLNYTKVTTIRFVCFAISGLVAILGSIISKSVLSMVARDLAFGVAFLVVSFLLSKEKVRFRWDRPTINEIVRFARGLWFVRGSSEGAKRIALSLLLICLDAHQFGLFFQMRSILEGVLTFFLYPIQSVLFSYFRSHRGEFNPRLIVLCVVSGCFVLSICGMLFFDLWGANFISLLLGAEWTQGSVALGPLAIYACIVLSFEVLVSMAQANNAMRPIVLARLCWIVAIFAFIPPLATRYQLLGAAWATSLSSVAMFIVGLTLLLPHLQRVQRV